MLDLTILKNQNMEMNQEGDEQLLLSLEMNL